MSAVVIFLDSALSQALFGMLIWLNCSLTMSLLLFLKPYKQWTDTLVSSVMQFQLFLTLFLGIILQSQTINSDSTTITMVILASGLFTVILTGLLIINEIITSTKQEYLTAKTRRKNAIATYIQKLWKAAFRYALYQSCTTGHYYPKNHLCIPAMLHLGNHLRMAFRRVKAFDQPAPANYVAGVGRGAIGFTTRSDIGPARSDDPVDLIGMGRGRGLTMGGIPIGMPGGGRGSGTAGVGGFGRETDESGDRGDYSETNYDEFSGYTGAGLFNDMPYDQDDAEADDIYAKIDERMDSKRKRRRELKQLEDMKKARRERPKISDQFADLKTSLSEVSDAEWEAIPDIGDHSLRYKQQRRAEIYTPVPDNLLDPRTQTSTTVVGTDTPSGLASTIGGMTSSLTGLAEARGAVLSLKLDKMSDSISGQTVVDPKGYLTDLNSLKITSDAEVGDIKKARLLMRSVTTTNPKHAPGWIAAARLEEVAGKLVQARSIIAQGCESCPTSEDVWLEAARLQTPENAKKILANAVRHVPTSVKVWLAAAKLESSDDATKLVLRRALEFIPNAVAIWKAVIELEDAEGARLMLGRAVECVPQSVDMWLALARLETYEHAKRTLNRARATIPTDPTIWIAAAKLEEANGKGNNVDKIIMAAIRSLNRNDIVIDRDTWLKEAEACEQAEAPLTCAALVRQTLNIGVEEEDRKRTWIDDAETFTSKGAYITAKAIYSVALETFPTKKSIWLRAVALEKQMNTADSKANIMVLLQKAIEACPLCEVLWLMAAKEAWLQGSVDEARSILRRAFLQNPNSEEIWIAAVKLEWENNEIQRARALLAKARAQAPTARVWMKSILLEREIEIDSAEEALLLEGMGRYKTFDKMYMMAGQYYEGRENWESARKAYRDGIAACPKSVPLWKLSCNLEERTQGPVKARTVLELARLRNPKNDLLWLEAVRLERRHGNIKGQENLLAKALQECPDSGMLLAESIELAPRTQKKRVSLEALKKKDNDPAVCLSVSRLFWHERKVTKARKWFERTVQLNPDFGDGWAYYYAFELKDGNESQRNDVLNRCVNAEPRHGSLWCAISKQTANRKKSTKDLLKLVVASLPVLNQE
ncbi:pre-mRNA-processing factor [Thraustotheca clavata]|uniref:Pre-mRNA-processing factor n=1 Tax=Thraustotheca clavata TaxID=74557 RepID=A0A1V9ZC51_9STRA|nr:pre-mRNA-processing factor [Thraustotheca clavata]